MKPNEIQGQMSIEGTNPTATVATVKPTKPSAGTVASGAGQKPPQDKPTTPEKASEEARKRFDQRQEADRARLSETRARAVEPPKIPPVEVADDGADLEEEEFDAIPEKKKKRKICKKYGIREKELKKAIEQARKLFVPKMGANYDSKLLIAIIELLEYGDI
ncbi:MAG: hypothetical protein IJB34_00040 [Clostridia bacterium]|nr:hypothetical protein [Clostridia bacterium]MBQ3505790.1 hypothetical protein [Clostridia bacterium]